MKHALIIAVLAVLATGCARFSTKQIDVSYDENGNKIREIQTKAQAYTLIQSSSELANWEASQDNQAQGAKVGSLNQASSAGTNVTEALNAILKIVEAVK